LDYLARSVCDLLPVPMIWDRHFFHLLQVSIFWPLIWII
jgi:hypothetical protein